MNKLVKAKTIIALSVAVVTFAVYLPTLQNGFINWDDNEYVYKNTFIRSFDAHLFKSAFTEFHASNWHPLTWISHAFDYAIWGLNPLGHHLTNNILHTLNTLVVVFLVMRLMEIARKAAANDGLSEPLLNDRMIMITGTATGLLFGVHPLHVESVAWVAERKDLLCAFFFLLSIITYTHYVTDIRSRAATNPASRFLNKNYLLATGFFILSLLSKPMAVSLPLVLLILDWFPFGKIHSLRSLWSALVEKIPFISLSLVSSLLTIMAQSRTIYSLKFIPLSARLSVAAEALMVYLIKTVLPINLVPFYPYPKNMSLFSLEHIIPILILLGVTAACIAVMRSRKLWISLWSYYVITLIPVLGIVQVGSQSMADRYMYLPILGPLTVIGLTVARIYEKLSILNRWNSALKMAGYLIAITVLAFLSYATVRQISVWKNSVVFWSYVTNREPTATIAYNNLGNAYLANGQVDMAIDQYHNALRLEPDFEKAHNNLGNAYFSKGLFDMAIDQYRDALKLRPDYAEAHFDLGNAYFSKDLFDRAIDQYRDALRLKPDYGEAHYNLGLIYLNRGSQDMAKTEFELALKTMPDNYEVQQALNSILSK